MTLLQLLTSMVGPAEDLALILARAGEAAPDLKPAADVWIERLNGAVAPANLVALAEALPKELANIAAGRIDPKFHPSDAG